jgi:hypothetical protein
MIKESMGAKDLLPSLWVNVIIECQEKPVFSKRCWDSFSGCSPESFPCNNLGGGHKGIEPPLGNIGRSEDVMENNGAGWMFSRN